MKRLDWSRDKERARIEPLLPRALPDRTSRRSPQPLGSQISWRRAAERKRGWLIVITSRAVIAGKERRSHPIDRVENAVVIAAIRRTPVIVAHRIGGAIAKRTGFCHGGRRWRTR
jgi:hypothetical protein